MSQRFDAEDVVQVGDELVVGIGQGHESGQPQPVAQPLDRGEPLARATRAERGEVGITQIPRGPREHRPSAPDSGQERRVPERSPVPPDALGDALILQRAQEAVDGQAPDDVIVRGRQPGHHLSPEPGGPEHDPPVPDGDQQVRHRELPVGGGARATQVPDLVGPQDRPAEYVPQPALGLMHDLGENEVWPQRFLGSQVLTHKRVQLVVGMAETSEQASTGGTRRGADHDMEVPVPDARR